MSPAEHLAQARQHLRWALQRHPGSVELDEVTRLILEAVARLGLATKLLPADDERMAA